MRTKESAASWTYESPPISKASEKRMASHDAAELVKAIDAVVELAQENPTERVHQAVEQFAAALVLDYVERRMRRVGKEATQ